jgi:hypothetical protein
MQEWLLAESRNKILKRLNNYCCILTTIKNGIVLLKAFVQVERN